MSEEKKQNSIMVPLDDLDKVSESDSNTVDELAMELAAIHQSAKKVAIIGSRNLPITHQQLIEILSYALVKQGNTVITSGGSSGTNAAAIRGAMSANPDKLRVILPQTIETIDTAAFKNCTSLAFIDLPYSAVYYSNTFNGCSSLKEIIIPNGTQSLGRDNCFKDCSSVEKIVIPMPWSLPLGYYVFKPVLGKMTVFLVFHRSYLPNYLFTALLYSRTLLRSMYSIDILMYYFDFLSFPRGCVSPIRS